MNDNTRKLLALLIGGALAWYCFSAKPPAPVTPTLPDCPLCPVEPKPDPPKPPRRPWADCEGAGPSHRLRGQNTGSGKISPDGTEELQCDLPREEKKRNTGGSDGAGLCVFTSIEWCARWQNEPRLWEFQAFMRKKPGGGYPQKVDAMIKEFAPGVSYIQHTGGDMGLLKAALKTGRMCGVTWNRNHMLCCVHASDKWFAISDNNAPDDSSIKWMSPKDFERQWSNGEKGWFFLLLNPPPPPMPRNLRTPALEELALPLCEQLTGYQWEKRDDGNYLLTKDGKYQGVYFVAGEKKGKYLPWDGFRWLAETRPPIAPPAKPMPEPLPAPGHEEEKNFGLDWDKIEPDETILNGKKVEKADALAAIQDCRDGVPCDAHKYRITVVGNEAQRKQVVQDLLAHPALAPQRDQFLRQDYDPAHWAVRNVFQAGSPSIYVQSPDGTVLHSQPNYDGPDRLATALRRVRPDYDPKLDPDRRNMPFLPFDPKDVPPWGWAAGGAGIFALLQRKEKKS